MDNEYVKKLIGKNQQDFEFAAAHIINNSDVEAFRVLVKNSNFLFDFVKENVKNRLANVINKNNYKNLFPFLKIYSDDFEDLIISTLVKFANEELTDMMLNSLEKGTNDEKAYAAKYFSIINDPLAIDFLRENAYSEFDALALNCAESLSALEDIVAYYKAIEKLKSDDEFEKMAAVRFLVAYRNQDAIEPIFNAMKKSSMPENIAAEIPYLKQFFDLLYENQDDTLLALNHVIDGLGEIVSLDQVFNCQLFEILERGINKVSVHSDSKTSVLLLNAKLKVEQLTENTEYTYDESKITTEELYAIKDLLNSKPKEFWDVQKKEIFKELNAESEFVSFALEIVRELSLSTAFENLRVLLFCNNQTLILKTVEVIKSLDKLNEIDKDDVLSRISDQNIRMIIQSLFA